MCQFVFLILAIKIFIVRSQTTNAEYENVLNEDGYYFRYKTDDSERAENGVIGQVMGDNRLVSVNGFYSYVGNDGKMYHVDFVADEKGYRPSVKFGEKTKISSRVGEKSESPFVPYIGTAVLNSLIGGGIG